MRPQDPFPPPDRHTGTGGETIRAEGADRYEPDAYGDYAGSPGRHAEQDGADGPVDPYGDVSVPSAPSRGVRAPYGSSGWSGSERHPTRPSSLSGAEFPRADFPGADGLGPRPDGHPGYGAHGTSVSWGQGQPPGYGGRPDNGATGGAPSFGPGSPSNGPPPVAASYGSPYPGGAPTAGPVLPATGPVHAVGPPAPPPRANAAQVGPTPSPGAPWGAGPGSAAAAGPSDGAGLPGSPGDSFDDGRAPAAGGLAGADGLASRPPRPRDAATASTEVTRGADDGAGAGRHRVGPVPGPDHDGPTGAEADGAGPEDAGLEGASGTRAASRGGKSKRKGSFWRELPLLIVVAVVLTFVIQTFLGRIYIIPSASMERTLHGCNGCNNDRVAVDKISYRFSEPSPGDVVVFRGPPTWGDNGESGDGGGQRSDNVLVRGLQSGLSLVGLAPPDEKDFVKRVVATGGQTVACCDPQNRVTVDGQPLDEPYIFYQSNLGRTQADFAPVQVPAGQLWVMGDNRNNSADARVHGPIGVTDVIGKARVIVLPVGRWGGVPDTDPQAQVSALGAPSSTSTAPLAAGVLGAVPLVGVSRRLRARRRQADPDAPFPDAPFPDAPGRPTPSRIPDR